MLLFHCYCYLLFTVRTISSLELFVRFLCEINWNWISQLFSAWGGGRPEICENITLTPDVNTINLYRYAYDSHWQFTYRRTLWPVDNQTWYTGLSHHIQGDVMTGRLSVLIHRLISSHTGGRYDRETISPETPAYLITYRRTLWPVDNQTWYTGLSHHIQEDVMTGRQSDLIHRLISSHTGGRYDR